MKLLAPVKSIVYRSGFPHELFPYSPGLAVLPSGRLIATIDLGGPGVADKISGVKGIRYNSLCQGRAFVSDDGGDSWREVAQYPFMHARPFVAGRSVYILGHCSDLMMIRSNDDGETWSDVSSLTEGEDWHQAPCNVWYARENIYLVMERRPPHDCTNWPVSVIAPVLMRGQIESDLTKRENWTFASEVVFRDAVDVTQSRYFGFPMYQVDPKAGGDIRPDLSCAPWGWLETNVVQIMDKNHIWYDETGHTFHLFMRAHTGHTNYACVMKVVENSDGSMTTQFEHAPSGAVWLYLPLPGGQMKFHILYDDVSGKYWLLSTQATDSMIRPDRMPPDRYNLPDNERRRLQLHFSSNCVDWCFVGLVDMGETELQSRHYASMCIHGDDLCILSRSGDKDSISAHNGNVITFHLVKDFRFLVS